MAVVVPHPASANGPRRRVAASPIIKARVIAELIGGASISEAADRVGIHRQRISEWRKNDPAFGEALGKAHAETCEGLVSAGVHHALLALRSLAPRAVVALSEILEGDEPNPRLRAIDQVLRRITPPATHAEEGQLERWIAELDALEDTSE